MTIIATPSILGIDRKARAWQKKLIGCWCGHHNPRLYTYRESLVAALFLEAGMSSGPLPHDRLQLVQMATDREIPSRPAFVTLALCEYPDDKNSALLPYQLAWARTGRTLLETTGLPGGIASVRWPTGPITGDWL